jgi:hypothetical protein
LANSLCADNRQQHQEAEQKREQGKHGRFGRQKEGFGLARGAAQNFLHLHTADKESWFTANSQLPKSNISSKSFSLGRKIWLSPCNLIYWHFEFQNNKFLYWLHGSS